MLMSKNSILVFSYTKDFDAFSNMYYSAIVLCAKVRAMSSGGKNKKKNLKAKNILYQTQRP